MDSNSAVKAVISYLQDRNVKQDPNHQQLVQQKQEKPAPTWGIFTYFYNDQKCDYEASQTLIEGQALYRNRGDQDTAKIFVANGEVNRQKGD